VVPSDVVVLGQGDGVDLGVRGAVEVGRVVVVAGWGGRYEPGSVSGSGSANREEREMAAVDTSCRAA